MHTCSWQHYCSLINTSSPNNGWVTYLGVCLELHIKNLEVIRRLYIVILLHGMSNYHKFWLCVAKSLSLIILSMGTMDERLKFSSDESPKCCKTACVVWVNRETKVISVWTACVLTCLSHRYAVIIDRRYVSVIVDVDDNFCFSLTKWNTSSIKSQEILQITSLSFR